MENLDRIKDIEFTRTTLAVLHLTANREEARGIQNKAITIILERFKK
jgi:hypothetical protein